MRAWCSQNLTLRSPRPGSRISELSLGSLSSDRVLINYWKSYPCFLMASMYTLCEVVNVEVLGKGLPLGGQELFIRPVAPTWLGFGYAF